MSTQRKIIGNRGEQLVAEKLIRDGFSIIARNYTKQYGEIDLIASKKELLIFVEVKTRKHAYFDMTEVINRNKQRKIIAVAKEFIAQHTITNKVCRFDVAILEQSGNSMDICYIPNAFTEE